MPTMGDPMRFALGILAVVGVAVSGAAMAQAPAAGSSATVPSASFPAWAYPWAPDFKGPPDDGVPRHVPDSAAAFTMTQERDLFFAPDWHPDRSQFVAYVPLGSIAKGEALAKTGGPALQRPAPPAMAPTSRAWIPFPESPDVRRAISCARSTISSNTREPEARAL